jgi:hypothetical protein
MHRCAPTSILALDAAATVPTSANEAVENSSSDLAAAELSLQCFVEYLSGYDKDCRWHGTKTWTQG